MPASLNSARRSSARTVDGNRATSAAASTPALPKRQFIYGILPPMLILGLLLAVAQFSTSSSGDLRVIVTDPSGLPVRAVIEVSSQGTQYAIGSRRRAKGLRCYAACRSALTAWRRRPRVSRHHPERSRSGPPPRLNIASCCRSRSLQAAVTVGAADTFLDPHQAAPIQRIGRARVDERPAMTSARALVDLVNAEPGWLLEANGILHPRGSEYDTQYVVDGLPLTDNRSPAFAPPLGAESVRSLAILTGGYPAEYGRKLGGVIEVVTGAGGRQGVHGGAAFTAGSFETREGEASLGYATARQTLHVSGAASSTDRFLDPPVEENFTNTGMASRFAVRWESDLSRSDRIGLIARHGRLEFLVPNEHVQQAAGQEQSRNSRETAAQFSYRSIFSSRAVAEVVGMGRRVSAGLESNALSTPLIVEQDRSLSQGYVKGSVSVSHGIHELKAGVDVDYARVREALFYEITDPDDFDEDTPASFDFREEGTDSEQAIFLQDQIRSGPWTVNAGIRWDRYRFQRPRVGVEPAARGGARVSGERTRSFAPCTTASSRHPRSKTCCSPAPGVRRSQRRGRPVAGASVARALRRGRPVQDACGTRPRSTPAISCAGSTTSRTTTCS